MTSLYIRTQKDGRRTWEKVGSWNIIDGYWEGSKLKEDEYFIQVQVKPGMVYHARITEKDLIPGIVKKGR